VGAVVVYGRPSKRWEEANRARNTIHHRVTNLRRDGLNKLTTGPTATIGTVVVEDVNVAGMLRHHTAARPVDR
jgi:putative transposase